MENPKDLKQDLRNDREVKRAITAFINEVIGGSAIVPSNRIEGDEDVTLHNLKMMEEDMADLALSESMGGNAGGIMLEGKKYTCVGLNGYADRLTGKILAFGNVQNIPQSIKDTGTPFTFREALEINVKELLRAFEARVDRSEDPDAFIARLKKEGIIGKKKIIEFLGADRFTQKGRKNLEVSIDTYNKKYW